MRPALFAVGLAVLGLPLAPVAAAADPIPASIAADPPKDKDHPARSDAVQIKSHGQAMNALFYLAAGPGPHPTVILFHGHPGNEQNLDLAQAIRREGWNVLTLHYRGSWGSQGRYGLSNAAEDSEAALAWVRDPNTVERYNLAPGKVVVMGHSMGGFMAARLAAKDPSLMGAGLIAPWPIGDAAATLGKMTPAQLDAIFDDMPGRVVGADPRSIAAEAAAHQKDWTWAALEPGLAKAPILVVCPHDSGRTLNTGLASDLKAQGAPVTFVDIDTDHSFNDARIALQAAVILWLENLPGAPAGL